MQKPLPERRNNSLQISATPLHSLTKIQQDFNHWIAQIDRLRMEIAGIQSKYETLVSCMHKHLVPAYTNIANAKIQVASILEKAVLQQEFGKRQQQDIGKCILRLCRQAFALIDPTDEAQALHDRWAASAEQEEIVHPKVELKELIETQLEDLLSDEIDWEALKDHPEQLQRMLDALEEKRENDDSNGRNVNNANNQQHQPRKKKAQAQAAESLKHRSVRSIYIALAKLMHPDMEPDPSLRASKEEQMKNVIQAYEANDLAALLTLEMEWVYAQNNELGKMPEEKLRLFVEVLKDQARQMEAEKADLFWEPRYRPIQEFAHFKIEKGLRKIKEEANYMQALHKEIVALGKSFQETDGRKQIGIYVKDLLLHSQ